MIRITCSLIIMLLTVLGAYESQASSAVKDSVGSVESDTRPRKRRFLKHSKSLVVKSVPFPQAQIQDRLYFLPPSKVQHLLGKVLILGQSNRVPIVSGNGLRGLLPNPHHIAPYIFQYLPGGHALANGERYERHKERMDFSCRAH